MCMWDPNRTKKHQTLSRMGLSPAAFPLWEGQHTGMAQHSVLCPCLSHFSWDRATHHGLDAKAPRKHCWNGSRHTQHQLVPSWAQTYRTNVAPFTFFSGYLQEFLLNKGLILHSIKFYSGAFWSKPALHWDITGKDEELCCHPCTPKGRRVDALQHFLHSQGDTHNEFCHLHFMPDLAGCIWWFLGGRMLTAQWFLPKPPFSSTLFQKEKQLLLSWAFGATCPIGCWKQFQGCANIPKQRFGFRGTVIEWYRFEGPKDGASSLPSSFYISVLKLLKLERVTGPENETTLCTFPTNHTSVFSHPVPDKAKY